MAAISSRTSGSVVSARARASSNSAWLLTSRSIPPRSCSSWAMVCLKALPSTPTRFSLGTRTSVKNTSQKWRLVVMSLIGRTSMPGAVIGTMISLMPRCGGPSLAVRQIR
ncbi:MAG: hypothetical protein V9E89_13685 [Ilumatobacteraceae bacterium]